MARGGLGEEDHMHIQFANHIRALDTYGKLDCIWWSYDAGGENRSLITGSLLKKKGHKKGKPDYCFRQVVGLDNCYTQYVYLEFKTAKGKQTEEQKEFEETCKHSHLEDYYVVRSVNQAIKVLTEQEIIID